MADDLGAREEAVAACVIRVAVGVDKVAERLVGDSSELLDEGFSHRSDHRGVYDQQPVLTDQEASVADAPATVVLEVGVRVGSDFLEARSPLRWLT